MDELRFHPLGTFFRTLISLNGFFRTIFYDDGKPSLCILVSFSYLLRRIFLSRIYENLSFCGKFFRKQGMQSHFPSSHDTRNTIIRKKSPWISAGEQNALSATMLARSPRGFSLKGKILCILTLKVVHA